MNNNDQSQDTNQVLENMKNQPYNTNDNQYQQMSIDVNGYQQMLIDVNIYRQILIDIDKYLQMLIDIIGNQQEDDWLV